MKHFQRTFLLFIVCFCVFKTVAQSVGGTTSGSAIYCANANSGFVNLDTYNGSIISWESSTDSITWTPTGTAVIPSQSYTDLPTTTWFRVIVQDGAFPPDTSTVSCIEIYPPSVGGTITGAGTFCIVPGTGAGTLTLTGYSGDILYWQDSIVGGLSWDSIYNTDSTFNYLNLTQNTYYRAVVRNGSTCPMDTSFIASFSFDSVTVSGILPTSDTVCPEINSDTIHLTGNNGSVLYWLTSLDNGNTWSSISNTTSSQPYDSLIQTTLYKAVVKNGTCFSDTTGFAAITIIPNPISAGIDTTITIGQSIQLIGTGNGTAVWTPSTYLDSANVFTPTSTPETSIIYHLTVTDDHSCINRDSVIITIHLLEFNANVSNLFTPNGDGVNDTWYIQDILNYPDNEVFVYNIYGGLVYTKKGYGNDWDGTFNGSALPDGTYFYVLRFTDSEKINKGSLDILRSK